MKGFVYVGIGIIIVILIVGWIWFRPFLKKILSKYREHFSVTNVEDPVFLFRLLFDVAEYNGNPQLNYNVPYKDSITSKEERDLFIQQITSEGVSFTSRIIQVQISASLDKEHISELKNTGLTTIICDRDHYCLPGSNVTIKGLGELDGYYKNGVSVMKYSNEKQDISNRVDVIYNREQGTRAAESGSEQGTETKGSSLGFLHTFQLLKDSSQMQSIQTGVYKGYIESISPEATTEVKHKIYKDMPYNEWLACVLTAMYYLYGGNYGTSTSGYVLNLYGKVVEEWSQLSINTTYSVKCLTHNGYRFEPMQGLVVNNFRYLNRSKGQDKLLSIFNKFWTNDPYDIDSLFDKFFKPYIVDDYDLIGTPDVYGPVTSLNIIPILNYLKKGSVKNLYWGLKGTGQQTLEQQSVSKTLNMFNVEQKSIVGGTELTARLFDWINPYDYKNIKEGRTHPDPHTWIILGGKNTEDGRDRKLSYMDLYCGIVDEKFTNGRKVGYIYLSSFLFIKQIALNCANLFSGELPSGYEQYKGNEFIKAQYAIMKVLSPMMRYLVTEENCDSIIIDNRGNEGEDYLSCLSSFFGGERFGDRLYQVKNDTGFSFPLPILIDDMKEAFEKIHVKLAETLGGCVFKGTESKKKKVVILNSYGTRSILPVFFIGDRGDGYLGENTYATLIGNKTIGTISKSSIGAIDIPTISSKIKSTLEYSFVSGPIRILSADKGPLFNKTVYSDGFWNQVYGSAPIPKSLQGISGGSALRNDMSLLYYSLGIIEPPSDLFIKYDSYVNPSRNDSLTWKDPWLEQSIREAISEVVKLDIESLYPFFQFKRSENVNLISDSSFILESGQSLFTTKSWDAKFFNLQINFIIENGLIQFNPRGADDKGNTLIPLGDKLENVFLGFFDMNGDIRYGVGISSALYTTGLYAMGFLIGKNIRQFNTKITFPCSVSILIQENSQIYFTVNGYHMYQGNAISDENTTLQIGATFSHNIKDKKSVIVVKEFSLQ